MKTAFDSLGLTAVQKLIDEQLDMFLALETSRAKAIDKTYGKLLQTIREYTATGGKRLRPYLVLLLYAGYGGKDTEQIVPVATAWELLHTAMLIHDDIIDRDDMRHGQPNIFGRYKVIYKQFAAEDVSHYAMSTALQAGDLLIAASGKIILESDISDAQKVVITKLINEAIFLVGGGELLDTETALQSMHKTDARKIALQKTASYTFELPMISGALLAGASKQELTTLNQIGTKLGMAYQMIDDVLGVFGESEHTGKTTDGDIRERKHTVLIQETHKRLTGSEQKELELLYDITRQLDDGDIQRVRELIIASGAREVVMQEVQDLTSQAESLISSVSITEEVRTILLGLVAKLVKRNA